MTAVIGDYLVPLKVSPGMAGLLARLQQLKAQGGEFALIDLEQTLQNLAVVLA
jgi:hypothetical protein